MKLQRFTQFLIFFVFIAIFSLCSAYADDTTLDDDCLWIKWTADDFPVDTVPGGFENFHWPPSWSEIQFKKDYGNLRLQVSITSYAKEDLAWKEFINQQQAFRNSIGTTEDRYGQWTNTTSIVQDDEFFIARWPSHWKAMGAKAYYRGSVLSIYTSQCYDGEKFSNTCSETSSSVGGNLSATIDIMNLAIALIEQKCGPVKKIATSLEVDSLIETLPPDNESQAEIKVLVKDQFNDEMPDQLVHFATPSIGTLSLLSGITDSNGIVQTIYTAPELDQLNEEKFIDIIATHDTENINKGLRIFFDLPDNEPASLEVDVQPDELSADGQNTADITITLTNTAGYLLTGESLTLEPPAAGTLTPLSGITQEDGTFKATYTVPNYTDVQGHTSIDIVARHTETQLTGSASIRFLLASLSTICAPSTPSIPGDTALIPGDIRFPAMYTLILKTPSGDVLPDIPLEISIPDSRVARLEGQNSLGSNITITTDEKGEALVKYFFLGDPPENAPFVDTITIKNTNLGMESTVHAAVGLDIQISALNRALDGNQGSFPKTLALRYQLQDNFHPDMNLFTYLTDLESVTGSKIGIHLKTQWLSKPSPKFMDNFKIFFPNLANPQEPLVYNGLSVVSLGDNKLSQVIVEALDQPSRIIGPNTFPAIQFDAPGLYWFRAVASPVVLTEGSLSFSDDDLVHGATLWDTGPIFSANIQEEAESIVQSLACMFNPTSKQQFMAKSLFLDNPLLTGLSVAGGIPFVAVAVTKVSSILCDVMNKNYFTAMANLISLDIEMRENLLEKGIWSLTESEQAQMARVHLLNYYWANWSAGNESWNQFSATKTHQSYGMRTSLAESDSVVDTWPEGLVFKEYLDYISQLMAGALASHNYFKGWDLIAVLGAQQIPILENSSTDVLSIGEEGMMIYLCPSRSAILSVVADSDLKIYHHRSEKTGSVTIRSYTAAGTGENTGYMIDFSQENIVFVDRSMDGSYEESILPQTTVSAFLAGDIDGNKQVDMTDFFLLLQIITGIDIQVPEVDLVNRFADSDGDQKAGSPESIFVLQKLSLKR